MPNTPSKSNSLPAVLITGCSSGLGHALALRFVKAGHPTYATARSMESISDLAAAGCHTWQLDVTNARQIADAVATVEQQYGQVGILINNAAIGLMTPIETVPIEQVRQQYETNVFGVLAVTQAVIPCMRKAGVGRIVNIGSSGGEFTTPGGGVYQATKYALDSMTDAMRMELKVFGIDVVLIESGAIACKFASNGAVLGTDEGSYMQLMRGIERLAAVVYKAAIMRRPKARYRPGIVAKALIQVRLWLPTRMWDYMFVSWLTRAGK